MYFELINSIGDTVIAKYSHIKILNLVISGSTFSWGGQTWSIYKMWSVHLLLKWRKDYQTKSQKGKVGLNYLGSKIWCPKTKSMVAHNLVKQKSGQGCFCSTGLVQKWLSNSLTEQAQGAWAWQSWGEGWRVRWCHAESIDIQLGKKGEPWRWVLGMDALPSKRTGSTGPRPKEFLRALRWEWEWNGQSWRCPTHRA